MIPLRGAERIINLPTKSAERDRRHLPFGLGNLQENLLLLAHGAGQEHARNGLDRIVVLQHRVVVKLAGVSDLVLHTREFILQRTEVLVGAQLRVGFGHGEETTERPAHLVGSLCRFSDRTGIHHCLSRTVDGVEYLTLVRRITLHRLDDVGNEVVSTLQLHIDLTPRVFIAVLEGDDAVVDRNRNYGQNGQNHQDDDRSHSSSYTDGARPGKLGQTIGGKPVTQSYTIREVKLSSRNPGAAVAPLDTHRSPLRSARLSRHRPADDRRRREPPIVPWSLRRAAPRTAERTHLPGSRRSLRLPASGGTSPEPLPVRELPSGRTAGSCGWPAGLASGTSPSYQRPRCC